MLLSAARSSTVPYLFVTAISGALPRCPWSPYLLLCFMCTFRLIYRNLITLMTLLVPCPVVSCPFLSYSRRLLHSLVLGMNLDAALVIVGSPKTSSLCVGIFICFSFFFLQFVCLFCFSVISLLFWEVLWQITSNDLVLRQTSQSHRSRCCHFLHFMSIM